MRRCRYTAPKNIKYDKRVETLYSMYRYDADELDTMANGIVVAIKKYDIPVDQLTDQEIWEELQRKGYKFPFWGKRYFNYLDETAWWFEALHLAIQRLRG